MPLLGNIRVVPESALQCDICYNDFDQQIHKPLVLYPCSHTICSECISRLPAQICPTCRTTFTSRAPNFSFINLLTMRRISISTIQPIISPSAPPLDQQLSRQSTMISTNQPITIPAATLHNPEPYPPPISIPNSSFECCSRCLWNIRFFFWMLDSAKRSDFKN